MSSAKPDVQTPNVEGLSGEMRDDLRNEEREAPVAPKTSGSKKPAPNALQTPADLREAGGLEHPLGVDDPHSGP